MSIDSSRIKIHYISQLINSLNMLAEKWCGIFICLLKHKKNITTGESELRNWGSVSTNKVFKTLVGIIAAYWRHSNRLNKHLFQPYILTGASNSTQDSEVKQWCRAALKPRKLNCARQVLEKWVFGDWFDIWFTNSWQTRDLTTYLKIGPWDCSLVGFTYKLSLTPLFTKKKHWQADMQLYFTCTGQQSYSNCCNCNWSAWMGNGAPEGPLFANIWSPHQSKNYPEKLSCLDCSGRFD